MVDVFKAMNFARDVHKLQKRKYTDAPYFTHLCEVAGILSTVTQNETKIAVAYLHDCMEDQGVTFDTLKDEFGYDVADGVRWLSDMEEGNRSERKRLSCERLSKAPGWVQTIKCADLISNTCSIVQYDPKFANVYLHEKQTLLVCMDNADPKLWGMAAKITKDGVEKLKRREILSNMAERDADLLLKGY